MKMFLQYIGKELEHEYKFFISINCKDITWLKYNSELVIAAHLYDTVKFSKAYKEIKSENTK
jgi:hypothetical protein